MSANLSIPAIDNPVEGSGGLVWTRLQSEREDICETVLREVRPVFETHSGAQRVSNEYPMRAANWHRELIQARLRKIDNALDRLGAGSYGNCSKCGRWIEDSKLEFDPAIAFCIDCWQREQSRARTDRLTCGNDQIHRQNIPSCDVLDHAIDTNPWLGGVGLETLTRFDTIWVRTLNSDYRIFLLDPRTGRSLVEGGHHFVEPVEAIVSGPARVDSSVRIGWIGIGLPIEIWANGKFVSTSPVQSVRVEHQPQAETLKTL